MAAAVRYLVADVDRAVAFYVEHLGFDLRRADGRGLRPGPSRRPDPVAERPGVVGGRPMPDGRQPVAGGWNRFVLEVDDLATRVEAMRDAGVTFRNAIVTGPGGKQILAEDPDGNVIELFEARR